MRLRANAHGGGGVDVGLRSHAQLWRARASGGDRGDSRAIISLAALSELRRSCNSAVGCGEGK